MKEERDLKAIWLAGVLVLLAATGSPPPMTYVITEACIGVKDRACVEVCPVDCIYEGEDQLYIHPDECIECGACGRSAR